jgi:hypothetical protein
MYEIQFEHNPDATIIAKSFPKSPYFSAEAFEIRENWGGLWTDIIAAYVWWSVVWVLSWSLLSKSKGNTLKIDLVEVVEEYMGNHIGRRLIQEAESINSWKFNSEEWCLNNPFNIASLKMFIASWFRRISPYTLQK